ncbi:TIGR03619 family F420-dependent LLM class oxidoreductase [Pseudofrankia sp. BMG5.36]|uniref:TIGR03619 family F420-dependent LLM class oxidoreductase n=1 Tax=Pseudofrankia sp. BMG5.36 TaxID=1834512 RepID=UPI0012FF8F9B|nr:TIGR03619 family F420-dependent LLM class oxidoreductase [Pseudofrankia sp. BMG5.36]
MPILDLAKACEERGFTGLFLNEHTHIPVDSSRSQYPPGGPIPERYARFWDPYIALSFVAAQTSLEIGPTVSLVGEHDPIALAKAVATLDVLSEGRLVLGVGWGWNREEFEAHGFPANRRAQVLGETLQLMTSLWTEEIASYSGEFLDLKPSRSWPKPYQKPRPPILLGVPPSPRNFERIAAWADGWVPMGNALFDSDLPRHLDAIAEQWEARGRTEAFRLSILLTGFRRPGDANAMTAVAMGPAQASDVLERAEKVRAERLIVGGLGHVGADKILPRLDRLADAFGKALR